MAILIDKNTTFLIQGITGKQGTRACHEMQESGARVVAGVTPGKGGEFVEGVPVYNTIKEAQQVHETTASVLYIPPRFAKEAIIEAIEAQIPLLNIVTENIPMHDMAYCLALAAQRGTRIIGACSAGIYSVGKVKCGSIAGGKSHIAFTPGPIGVISRSGGMSCETSLVLTKAGLGQSTVVSIGSDVLMGSTFLDLLPDFEQDQATEGIVLFGEIGGTAEEELASYLVNRRELGNPFRKPLVAFISGKFAEEIKIQNVSLGHAGAIIEGNKGTRRHKVKVLQEAGVIIADVHHQIGTLMKEALQERKKKITMHHGL